MAHSTHTIRIAVASLVAVLMMGGTFASTGPNPFFGLTRIAGAQSSEELLREYAAKDTDTDGLPDWQEALYGTDPSNPESFQAGTKDGDAVAQGLIQPKVMVAEAPEATDLTTVPGTVAAPSSVTDRFAQTLLKQYLLNRGETPPTQAEVAAFVQSGVAELSTESISPNRFSAGDAALASGSGTERFYTYAAEMETAFERNTPVNAKTGLSYFSDAMSGDTAALKKLSTLSRAYLAIAKDVMVTPVPSEARQAHVAIANALVHMSEVTEDMATMDTDPVRALMGISLYERYTGDLVSGFSNLHGVFSAWQVSIPRGTPGFNTTKTAADAAAQ